MPKISRKNTINNNQKSAPPTDNKVIDREREREKESELDRSENPVIFWIK